MLLVDFESFDVEYHPKCLYDSVKIYNGNEALSATLNKTLCGQTIPYQYISSGSSLVLKFVTDHVVQKKGFQAKISGMLTFFGFSHVISCG